MAVKGYREVHDVSTQSNLDGAAEPASRRVCPGRRSIFTWSISARVSPGWAWSPGRSIARHRVSRSRLAPDHIRVSIPPGMIETSDAAGAPRAPSSRTFSESVPLCRESTCLRYYFII